MKENKIFVDYIDHFQGEYINMVIEKVKTISNLLYDDRNKEQVIRLYLDHEVSRRNKMKQIKNLHMEIEGEGLKQESLYNRPVEILRNEGKLYPLLRNLSMEELHKLRNIVNIQPEFERLDKEKFEEIKRNRGTTVGTSLTN